jgi:hypothetical protein
MAYTKDYLAGPIRHKPLVLWALVLCQANGRAIHCKSSVCSVPPHPCGLFVAIPTRK